jgi:hypothetical protein
MECESYEPLEVLKPLTPQRWTGGPSTMYTQTVPNTVCCSQQQRKSQQRKSCILLVIGMPVPWEALIPFGKPAPLFFPFSAEFTRSGHRTVRRCWNTVECVQTRTKPGQGKSIPSHYVSVPIRLSSHVPIPASEISYRLLGGHDDGQRPATHRTCTETNGTNLTFPAFLYAVYSTFVTV